MRLTDKDGNPITLRQMHDRISDMLEIPDMDAGVQHDYAMFKELLEEASDGGALALEDGAIVAPHGWRTVPPPGWVLCSDGVARPEASFYRRDVIVQTPTEANREMATVIDNLRIKLAALKTASAFEGTGAVNVTNGEASETFIARARGADHIGDANEMIGKPAAPVWRSMDDPPEDGRLVLAVEGLNDPRYGPCYHITFRTDGQWMGMSASRYQFWTELPTPPEVKS